MEEKLKEILDNYEEKIERYEMQVEKLVAKMDFCKAHNFEEEFRIANDINQQHEKLTNSKRFSKGLG